MIIAASPRSSLSRLVMGDPFLYRDSTAGRWPKPAQSWPWHHQPGRYEPTAASLVATMGLSCTIPTHHERREGEPHMLLEGKIAVIYGASGGIGSVVARAFASAGATVVLAGRTMEPLVALADAIHAAGGKAEPTPADALDSSAVARHVDSVVDRFGRIDVSFNLVGISHRQGRPLVDIPVGEFANPIREYATTQFLTATAAARKMVPQGSGVILMLSTQPARLATPLSGPFGAAMAMVEAFSRNLAAEV